MKKSQIVVFILALLAGVLVGVLGGRMWDFSSFEKTDEPKPVVLSEESLSTVELVDSVSPAVVSIIERQVLATTKKNVLVHLD